MGRAHHAAQTQPMQIDVERMVQETLKKLFNVCILRTDVCQYHRLLAVQQFYSTKLIAQSQRRTAL